MLPLPGWTAIAPPRHLSPLCFFDSDSQQIKTRTRTRWQFRWNICDFWTRVAAVA
jgi:hypothetical protein